MRNHFYTIRKLKAVGFFIVLTLSGINASAQLVSTYAFSQSNGTYVPITGGTAIATATGITSSNDNSLDQGNYAVSIPFSFTYNGTAYTSCNANGNGYITFGATLPTTSGTTPISSATAYAGAVSAMGRDIWGLFITTGTRSIGSNTITGVTNFTGIAVGKLVRVTSGVVAGTTITAFNVGLGTITMSNNSTTAVTNGFVGWPVGEIRVETIGFAPNRICVIQYSGMADNSTTTPLDNTMAFQIQLAEGGGVSVNQTVSIVYGPQTNLSTTARTQQVGLRGAANTDFHNRTSATDWSATTAGGTNSVTVTRTNAIFPATGLTYTWTPPNFCAGAPAPGNTISTLNPVCSGTNFTLSLQNNPVVLGLSYQWQSSLSNFVSDSIIIGGATNATYSTNQAVTTYYRCKVSCFYSGLFSYSNTIQVMVAANTSGTFTINNTLPLSGSNFPSFSSAVSALACGISGPVVFNVDAGSGPYNEQVIIPAIPGTSASNTVTFNGNGRVVNFGSANTNERAAIKLNGADYVTIDNLVVNAGGNTYGFGIQLLNDADNNTISNCSITTDTSSTSTVNYAGILINSSATAIITAGNSLCDSNLISGNTINGGQAGVGIVANSSTSEVHNNKVINNIIKNFNQYGVYLNGNSNTLIEGNNISRPTRSTLTEFRGVFLTANSRNCLVSKNRIHNPMDGNLAQNSSCFAISFINLNPPVGSENIFSNNLVYNFISNHTTSNMNGFLLTSSSNAKIYHNTIVLDHAGAVATGGTRGLYFTTPAVNNQVDIRNNIFIISRGGNGPKQCLYFENTGINISSDYNDLYMTSTGGTVNEVGFANGVDYISLSDWQLGTGVDTNSTATYAGFAAPGAGNYMPTSPLLDNTGTNVGISTDILGNTRSVTTPDPGAYEFTPAGLDATITLVSPVPPVGLGNQTVTVNIFNSLVTTITDIDLAYTDGAITQSQSFSGLNITSGANQNLSFTTPYNLTSPVVFRAYITSVNSGTDLNQLNDTTAGQALCAALPGGTYTINSALATGGSNYNSFTDAVAALNCGITGPIVFNVDAASGPYNEQISIPAVTGASATNTIVFNGNGRTLQFASTNTNARAVIKLNGADYVTFDSLVLNFSGGTFGWGIHLINQADHNTISRCTLNGDFTSTSNSSYIGIVLSGSNSSATTAGNSGSYNTITGCTLNGSGVGISIYGTTTNPYITDNNILNNKIRDFYTWGIYSQANNNTVVSGNIFERPTRTTVGSFFGMDILSNTRNLLVEKNIFRNPYGGNPSSTSSSNICIYLSNGSVPAGMEPVVINNVMYNLNGQGDIYGIYLTNSPVCKVYHNTVSMDETTSTSTATAYGIYFVTSSPTAQDVRNNIVTITRGGTGQKACIYMSSTSGSTCNNNVLYMNAASGTSNYTGYFSSTSTGYPSLAAWQTANGGIYDQQSKDLNPLYTNLGTGNLLPTEALINNMGANVGVTTDFTGTSRILVNPDPGAYEFTPVGLDAGITWVSPAVNAPAGSHNIVVNIINNKTTTITSLDLSYAVGLSIVNESFTGLSLLPFTSQQFTFAVPYNVTDYTSFTAFITGVNGITDDIQVNDTIESRICMPLSGTYTIDASIFSGGGNFRSFSKAVEALTCNGITGPVTFNVVSGSGPYIEQIVIPSITGASSLNKISFNGNGEMLTFNSTLGAKRAAIALDGADYITVNNLVIAALGDTTTEFGYGVQLYNDADNNVISNCTISSDMTTTSSSNFAGIVITSSAAPSSLTTTGVSLCDDNTFTGNTITGGYAGIIMVANSATSTISNNKITNNTISDFYFSGIYLNGGINTLIEGNNISRPNRTVLTTFNGINLTNRSLKTFVSKNRIHDPYGSGAANTSQTNGILISACDANAGNENIISNNLLYNLKSEGIMYPVNNTGSDYALFYHNTIYVNDQAATTASGFTRGFFQTTVATGLQYKNNIVYISRTSVADKHCIYFNTNTTTYTSDHNDFFIVPSGGAVNAIGSFNAVTYSTLSSWQAGTSQDAGSGSINPLFSDPLTGNFQPTESVIDNIGVNVNISDDITGATRSVSTPDPGAYEFSISPCVNPPIAGLTVSTSTTICTSTSFTLSLFGNTSGAGQFHQWQSTTDGITWSDIGGATTQSYSLQQTTSTFYRCIVTCGAASDTSNPLLVTTPGFVSGTYTINSAIATGGSNFQSFTDAVSYIQCGINGPVVFNVAAGSGPYNEQITIPAISGTSAVNTITFNGNGQMIKNASSNSSLRAVIRLNGADYVTLNNLVIDGSAGIYGMGVFLTNQADHNTINNCTIKVSTTATTENHKGIAVSNSPTAHLAGNNANYTTISNNTITGGYYGIDFYGNSEPNQVDGNVITNNIVREFYYYGIYNNGADGSVISNNILERPTRSVVSTTNYLLSVVSSKGAMVKNNQIRNMFGNAPGISGTVYCLYVSADGTLGNENNFINNVVSDIGTNGTIYGVYLTGADFVNVYHNTIALNNPSSTGTSTTYGIYSSGTIGGITIKNNNITINRGGTGSKYCLYYSNNLPVSNNNNLYNTSATGSIIGYNSSITYATLGFWQTANGGAWDQQSLSVNPQYTNPATYDYKPLNAALDNGGSPVGVTTDVLANARSLTTPDIGAYEFDGTPCNGTPTAGTATALSTDLCAGGENTTQLTLSGYSVFGGINLQWMQSSTPGGPYTNAVGGTGAGSAVYTTAPLTENTYFICRVICSNSNDTVYSNMLSLSVVNPQLLTTTGASRCGPGSVTLQATAPAGASISWYNGTDPNPLGSGNSFTTPFVAATTDFYAAAIGNGTIRVVGLSVNSPASGTFTQSASTDLALRFNVFTQGVITKVYVYPTAAGTLILALRNALSNVNLQTYSMVVTPAQVGTKLLVPVNFSVAPGNYQITNISGGIGRYNPYTGGYPFAADNGSISILGSAPSSTAAIVATTYNGYFDLTFSSSCEGSRTAVTATINPSPAISSSVSLSPVCTSTNVTLNVTSANSGYTYSWTPGNLTGPTQVVAPSTTTFYTLLATDTSGGPFNGCNAIDTVRLYVQPPVVTISAAPATLCVSGTATLSLNPSANYAPNSIQWQSSTDSVNYFDIPGATASVLITPVISSTTHFKAKIKDGNNAVCMDVYRTISVTEAAINSTTGASRCGPGTVDLHATGSGTINWYANASGGTPIGSGSTFTTPVITANTNFYVSASGGGGNTQVVGANDLSIGASGISSTYYMNFSVLTTTTIQSVDVFFSGSIGSAYTIVIRDAATSTVVYTYSGTVTTNGTSVAQVIPINATLSAGNYQMGWSTNPGVYRNSSGGAYPYTIPGVFSITGNSFNDLDFYYYFYRWVVGTVCESNRIPVAVTFTPSTPVSAAGSPTTICAGSAASLSVSSVNSNYHYTWNPGSLTGSSVSVNPATSTVFTVTAYDSTSGCQNLGNVLIAVNQLPVVNLTSTASVLCSGDSTQLSTNVLIGNMYAWSPASGLSATNIANPKASPSGTTTYTISVTSNITGCSATSSINIGVSQIPAPYVVPNDTTLCTGSIVNISARDSGAYSNGWPSGTLFDFGFGPSTDSLFLINGPGIYNSVVTLPGSMGGCSSVSPTANIIFRDAPVLFVNVDSVKCFGTNTGYVSSQVFLGGPPYRYKYYNQSGTLVRDFTTNLTEDTLFNAGAGQYCVIVNDIAGSVYPPPSCSSDSVCVFVPEPAQLIAGESHTAVTCNGGLTSVTITATGGTPPYTGEGTFSQGAGTQLYTVTDANGCTAQVNVVITQPAVLTSSPGVVYNACAYTSGNVSANASGGTVPYEYSWSTGATTASLANRPAGTYTVTVTDANGCSVTAAVVVAPPGVLTLSTTGVNLVCRGIASGSITLSVSGGIPAYSYLWNGGTTTQNRTGLAAGTYTVTVTDINGCTKTKTTVITQPATNLLINTSQTNVRCFGLTTGLASVSPSGGTAPYTYSWNTIPVKTTASLSGLTSGVYTCTVTDAIGCTKNAVITITEPTDITVFQTQSNVTFPGGNNGSATVSVSGGTAPYTYSWNTVPVKTTATITGLTAGTYKCTVTDSKSCNKKVTFIITEPIAKPGTGATSVWEIRAYPNPTSGVIMLAFENDAEEQFNLTLLDITGRLLLSEDKKAEKGQNEFIFDFTGFSKGVYFIRLSSADRSKMIRIVVE